RVVRAFLSVVSAGVSGLGLSIRLLQRPIDRRDRQRARDSGNVGARRAHPAARALPIRKSRSRSVVGGSEDDAPNGQRERLAYQGETARAAVPADRRNRSVINPPAFVATN